MNRISILAAVLAAATTFSLAPAAQAQLIGRDFQWRRGVPDCCRNGVCDFHRSHGDDRYDRHDRRDRDGRYGRHGRRGDLQALRRAAVRLESATDSFARSFDRGLDLSRLNGTRREDRLNEHAKRLERAADLFKDRVHHGAVSDRFVDDLFDTARTLDRFMDRARLHRSAERDWQRVERELEAVARYFNLRGWRSNERHDPRDRYDDRDRYRDRDDDRHDDRHDDRRDRGGRRR